jgi:FAD:protein FMN transferase
MEYTASYRAPQGRLCRRFAGACAGLGALILGACQAPPERSPSLERSVYLMGTSVEIRVVAVERTAAIAASEAIVRALEDTEARLSTWRSDSELSRVQRGEIEASPRLRAELDAALAWSAATDGAFEPRCAALVQAWDLRGPGRLPTPDEQRSAALDHSHWEEGGFGKGAGLAAVARELAAMPQVQGAQVNLGGQWLLHGPGRFEIRVADPDARQNAIATLHLAAGSVATSGNSERGIHIAGQSYGHVLDPRSGAPAFDFGSVTVIHPDPFAADCLATAFLVLGPEAALAWAARDPQLEVLIVERGPHGPLLRGSAGLDYTPAQRASLSPSLR